MATAVSPPEQKVVLHSVSWDTYERLLADHPEVTTTRFTYDCGELEIVVISCEHESIKLAVSQVINVLAEEMGIDTCPVGSTTFRREDLQRGFEPDAGYYIRNESLIRGKKEIDLAVDPPPDLVIEIDMTSPSLNKLPMLAAVGVPEVWRHDRATMSFFTLEADRYLERVESLAFPGLTPEVVNRFVASARVARRTVWVRELREWVRNRASG